MLRNVIPVLSIVNELLLKLFFPKLGPSNSYESLLYIDNIRHIFFLVLVERDSPADT